MAHELEHASPSPALAPRTAVKHQQWMRDPTARRQLVLQQQRQARRDLAQLTRQLVADESAASDAESDNTHSSSGGAGRRNQRRRSSKAASATQAAADDGMEISSTYASESAAASKRKTREERVKRRREHFARQLMVPEWMVDVPRDLNGKGSELGAGWYVLPRPEGKRCLVVANSGLTVARIPSGSILKKFPSALPSGSHKTNSSTEAYCILDCIFHEHDSTFYVLDVMCWKGYLLYNCTTEFRLYWLRDKLSESAISTATPANPFRFLPVPCYESDEHGIMEAYSTTFPFLKDGLLFYLKAAHYELGLSPLALVWKDANTSRYFVYTEKPSIVLRLDDASNFTTLEGITLFSADPEFLQQHELSEGDLAKFSFEHGYIDGEQVPRLTGLTFDKRCSPQRALADSWTKILFQYNARSSGVQIQHILEAAKANAEDVSEVAMEC
ncbi:hypothetical protein PybrP1_006855 [[Pythium] brassicae (nom. inval.)]|nr:hypothetical protein PybrP1_006855 [[Pythium] brassicae (nom. inval.)]